MEIKEDAIAAEEYAIEVMQDINSFTQPISNMEWDERLENAFLAGVEWAINKQGIND